MDRRTTGAALMFVAALLHSVRYLSAAILGSQLPGKSRELFRTMLEYVGPDLDRWALAALALAVAFFVWGEANLSKKR